jgi:hypothetical protein
MSLVYYQHSILARQFNHSGIASYPRHAISAACAERSREHVITYPSRIGQPYQMCGVDRLTVAARVAQHFNRSERRISLVDAW